MTPSEVSNTSAGQTAKEMLNIALVIIIALNTEGEIVIW
jgi:hypothetical protein